MEPLLASDNDESQNGIEFKPPTVTTKDRYPTTACQRRNETCGRVRLLIVTFIAFILICVSIASTGVELPPMVVHVPPDENPGM